MNILALDTASHACSVTLCNGRGDMYTRTESTAREHSRHILQLIDEVIEEAGLALTSIELLAWNAGPGSFTGLRIGASVIQALAYTLRVPVLSLSSLELLACAAASANDWAAADIAVAVDARMNGIYWAGFRVKNQVLERLEDDQLIQLSGFMLPDIYQNAINCCVAGDAWQTTELSQYGFEPASVYSTSKEVMALSRRKTAADWLHDPASVVPRYIGGVSNWKKRPIRGGGAT